MRYGLGPSRGSRVPPPVAAGAFHAYFVYDVADTIDLARLASVGGEGVARAVAAAPRSVVGLHRIRDATDRRAAAE